MATMNDFVDFQMHDPPHDLIGVRVSWIVHYHMPYGPLKEADDPGTFLQMMDGTVHHVRDNPTSVKCVIMDSLKD